MSTTVDRQRVWRGVLPHSAAARREPKVSTTAAPPVVPIVWNPAGDDRAQDAALRAARRVRALQAVTVRPPAEAAEAAASRKESARQSEPQTAASRKESTRQSEPEAARPAAAVREEVRKKQAATTKAAPERAEQVACKAERSRRAQPLALARESLAASERCRRLASQPGRLGMNLRDPPSEAGRQLLAALRVDENAAANTQAGRDGRHQPKLGVIQSSQKPGKCSELKTESGGAAASGGGRAKVSSSGRHQSESRTRSQLSHSISSRAPWLGIGFDNASALGGNNEPLAQEEPPAGEELEPVCELDRHTQMQRLQAELERVRHLEALLQSEKARGEL